MRFRLGFSALCCGVLAFGSPADAAVNAKSGNFRTSDGVSLHYFDAGSGAALVMIPGWTMPADIFEPQINELSKKFRVVVLDVRSQGDSEKTSVGNNVDRHARDIRELIDHLRLENVVLLGWSNGVPDVLTFIGQNGAANVRGLVLVDGMVDVSSPQMRDGMNGFLQQMQADRAKFMDSFVRHMYTSKQPDEYIQHIVQESLKTPAKTAVEELSSVLERGDFTGILAKVDRPVLYICERQLEFEGQLVRSKLPSARVEVFPNAGHALFVDDPEHFNRVVGEFVESVSRPSR
jgi:non-heme chloroperoxidase